MSDITALIGSLIIPGDWRAALGIIVLSYLLEDAALILAAGMASAGMLDIATAWAAAFIGILSGDLMVYAGARWLRKPFRRARALPPPGYRELVISRFIPGIRTFTCGWSGFSRMPATPFFAIVAGSGLIWTGAVFALVLRPGAQAGSWLDHARWLSLPMLILMLWNHRETIRGILAHKESLAHERV